jgi:hypothetical protein
MTRPATNRTRRNGTVRCAIYTRKSSEEGLEQQFNSLQAQREACEAFINSQPHEGWVCVPWRCRGCSKRGRGGLVPGQLGVVTGVQIDDTGRQYQTLGAHRLRCVGSRRAAATRDRPSGAAGASV